VLATATDFLAAAPRSFAELSQMLTERWPDEDVGTMRYGVRTHLPLVQVPDASPWRYPAKARYTLAESWLDRTVDPATDPASLARRYLATFGPAAAADFQTWSGLSSAKDTLAALRPELVTYRDEGRRELFDLPDVPLPDEEIAAPPRLLPEFDNILLAHSVRRRIVADAHRKQVYLPGLRVAPTFLVDGFVAGTWQLAAARKPAAPAVLSLTPFAPLPAPARDALAAEAEALLAFLQPEAAPRTVRFS
jgi:hypothetical protein